MIRRGMVGLHRGLSKHVKISLYGLSWEEVKKVRDALYDIAQKYVDEFKLSYEIPKA